MATKKRSMARKTSSLPTRIWSFGALPPRSGADLAREQLRLARLYYNDALNIERDRLTRYKRIRCKYHPKLRRLEKALEAANAAVEKVYEDIRERRQEDFADGKGARRDITPKEEESLSEAKSARVKAYEAVKLERAVFENSLKEVRDEWSERRKRTAEERGIKGSKALSEMNLEIFGDMCSEHWPEAWKELQGNDLDAVARHKLLRDDRRYADLTPRAKDLANKAVQQAVKTHKFGMPEPKHPNGEGRIAVDFKKGTTFDQLVKGLCPQLILRPQRPVKIVHGREVTLRNPSKRQDQFYIAIMRVGRASARQFVEFPVRLDRKPPPDAQVRWAWFLARRIGRRTVWQLQLTLEHASFAQAKRPAGVGEAHVNLRWRKIDGGFEVAGGDGVSVVIPELDKNSRPSVARSLLQCEQLQTYADEHWNELNRVLRLCGLARKLRTTRFRKQQRWNLEDLADRVFGKERLGRLWHAWKRHRFSIGGDLFSTFPRASAWARRNGIWQHRLVWWCYLWTRKEVHLREYIINQRRRSRAQRDELFRREAIRISTQFEKVTLDDIELAKLAKRPPTDKSDGWERSRRLRQLVAPGRFKQILVETMGKDRVTVIERKKEAEDTARGEESSQKKLRKKSTKRVTVARKRSKSKASPDPSQTVV